MDSDFIPVGYENSTVPLATLVFDTSMYFIFFFYSIVIFLLAIRQDSVTAGASLINLIVWAIELMDFFISRNLNFQFNTKDYIIFFFLIYFLVVGTNYRIKTRGNVFEIVNITNFSVLRFFTSKKLALKALKAGKRNDLLEQKLLISQLNSQFIKNSLYSIQRYVYKNDKELAASTIAKFSKLMRAILDFSREELILLGQDFQTLKLYLDLRATQSIRKLKYELILDSSINPENILIPPMLTLPFIDCFVNHDIDYYSEEIRLEIIFKMEGDNILCEISDAELDISNLIEDVIIQEALWQEFSEIVLERIALINSDMVSKNKVRFFKVFDGEKRLKGRIVQIPILTQLI